MPTEDDGALDLRFCRQLGERFGLSVADWRLLPVPGDSPCDPCSN